MNANLFSLIEGRATDPNNRFLWDRTGRVVSYGELFAAVRRYANALRSLGAEPGDRVAVQTDKTVHSIYLHLGTLAAGCVYLPLNTAYTPREVAYFLSDSEPSVLVCRPDATEQLEPLANQAGTRHMLTLGAEEDGSMVDLAAGQSTDYTTTDRTPADLAALLYTSGTTGRSKGAMLSHANLASNALALIDAWRMSDADCLLHALPIYHTHGLFVGLGTVALSGASLLYLPRFAAKEVIRHLPAATMMMGVPTFYSRLLAEPDLDRSLVSHIRVFISGSAPLSAQVHKDFNARTGHAILERYGMTETGMNTSNPFDGERRPGSVGFPLGDVEVVVADPATGTQLQTGERGSIEVRGPNVFAGYWRNEQKTSEAFRKDGAFITGDLGHFDQDGYLWIAGREKDLIISGGLNVYPAEVEMEVDAIPGVAEAAVIGVPHADFGEAVVAVVVAAADTNLTTDAIIGSLVNRLAKFKLPKAVFFVDELPRNTMGKIQKNVLRDTYKDTFNEEVSRPAHVE